MSVIRIIHNRENPYVQINKNALWNKNLSLKAIGLWARCLSRPDDWSFNVSEMAQSMKEGKRSIYTAIDELISEGYAIKVDHYEKNEDGKFSGGGVEYIFFEFPPTPEEKQKYIDDLKKCFRRCGFGDGRNGDSRNAPLLNTDKETKKEYTNITPIVPSGDNMPAAPAIPKRNKIIEEKKELAPRVFLSETQETAVKEKIKGSGLLVEDIYRELSDWKIGKQIQGGKNDYKAIVDWVIDAVKRKSAGKKAVNPKEEDDNKQIAIKIANNFPKLIRNRVIEGHGNHLTFALRDGTALKIYYSDPRFKELVISQLRKMGCSVDGLD